MKDIPPLTYAGLRYVLAFLCLVPFTFSPKKIQEIKTITKRDWIKLIALGLIFYTLTQGTQFLGLSLLPAVTVSLMLNFTPIIVAVMGIFLLSEKPSKLQWSGAILFMVGIFFYFFPVSLSSTRVAGIAVMIIGVLANSLAAVLGRNINREAKYSPLIITVVSMGIGSIIILAVGLALQGLPQLSLTNILYLLWLAVINTALAFTLWNLTLRSLTAMESSIINGTMLIQIAVLAWIFLDETINLHEGLGMFVAAAGAILVQIKNPFLNNVTLGKKI